jgi:putative transposase
MTDDSRPSRPSGDELSPARQTVNDMISAGLLDDLMGRVDAGGLALTGDGGVLPELVKAVLERGLAAELSGHLGYEKGDPAGRGSPNSRNGHSAKTVATEVGDVDLITDAVLDEVKAWQARPLEEIYPIMYLDALVVKVRDGHTVKNRAAHIAVGVDLDGVKHVLGSGSKPPKARNSGPGSAPNSVTAGSATR